MPDHSHSTLTPSELSTLEPRPKRAVTGKHVSTWDAMFLDLRVQEEAR